MTLIARLRRYFGRSKAADVTPPIDLAMTELVDKMEVKRGNIQLAQAVGSMPPPATSMQAMLDAARDVHIVDYGGEGRALEGIKTYRKSK